ncbi:MAG: UDP-N-acetylmuramoyl-tripeptide--D-alanyl-D-alanine ligase [Candidatus Omnitrophica bacterium]|nr:UDP-N-acetylmuramoyl-tripeptide--D-alanyl-D-alanine ligase [Candidatus Omnitrophota bacterium]
MVINNLKAIKNAVSPTHVSNAELFEAVKGFSIDSRSIRKGEAFIAVCGVHCDGHKYIKQAIDKGASLIIGQEHLKLSKVPYLKVNDSYQALSSIVRFIRNKAKPYVFAITGSVGKTTTKEMLAFLLEDKYKVLKNYQTENNILGVAKTMFSLGDHEIIALELGTNSPGEIEDLTSAICPDVGIITFIKPVHLEKLRTLKGVFNEKISLFSSNPRMKAVLNYDDIYLRKANIKRQVYYFGKNKKSDTYARLKSSNYQSSTFIVQDKFRLILKTPFSSFIYNALAAIQAARILKLPLKGLIEKLNNFNAFGDLRMRIKEMPKYILLNDTYNANPYSLGEAFKMVKKLPGQKIAVLGDMFELGEKACFYHKSLAKGVIKAGFDYCLLMGELTLHLKRELKSLGYRSVYHFSSHKDVVNFIKSKSKKTKYTVFLKGSRLMKLEKVFNLLSKT